MVPLFKKGDLMKKNQELKHLESKKKLTKLNYVVIIIPIAFFILIIITIAYFVFVYNSNENKLKRFLEYSGYTCNKLVCSKMINNENYMLNYQNKTLIIDNNELNITFNEKTPPILELKDTGTICNFLKNDYQPITSIDNTFTYSKNCEKYIPKVNEYMNHYKNILTSTGIL